MEQVAILVLLKQFWTLLNQFDFSLIYVNYEKSRDGEMMTMLSSRYLDIQM